MQSLRFDRSSAKKYSISAILVMLYAAWHSIYMLIYRHSHLLFVHMVDTKTFSNQVLADYEYYTHLLRYLSTYTHLRYSSAPSSLLIQPRRWHVFILIFLLLMLFYSIRYAFATYLASNALAAASLALIRLICGFDSRIRLGPANYFINFKSSYASTTLAFILALLLYGLIQLLRRNIDKLRSAS